MRRNNSRMHVLRQSDRGKERSIIIASMQRPMSSSLCGTSVGTCCSIRTVPPYAFPSKSFLVNISSAFAPGTRLIAAWRWASAIGTTAFS